MNKLTITDEKGLVIFEGTVENFKYKIAGEPNLPVGDLSFTLKATLVDVSPSSFDQTESNYECEHEYKAHTGLFEVDEFCIHCGTEK